MVNNNRIRQLKKSGEKRKGPVCYWMSRDQRAKDNWALIFSQELALKEKKDLIVLFCLSKTFLGATLRQYSFMMNGLRELSKDLKAKNIPFYLILGNPPDTVKSMITKHHISSIVCDFDPLRIKKQWKKEIIDNIDINIFEVDAHNIVPCWVASEKQEYAAYTIRPKIKKQLDDFLQDYPPLKKMPPNDLELDMDWDGLMADLDIDRKVKKVDWIRPGESAALDAMGHFIEKRLKHYGSKSNDPSKDFQSGLSPYLHFGNISSQRVVLEIEKLDLSHDTKWDYLEELIIRKELSDNFCNYNEHYDSANAFPDWAKNTLKDHESDKREYIYDRDEFENATTHDHLWNACQKEMVFGAKMHGYMRMYWAKKILEWSGGYKDALETAIYLNDKYELDGRDPNGYTGIAWSIGGVHDRAWKERDIFGKIRYMSYKGAKSKFDIQGYIDMVDKKYS